MEKKIFLAGKPYAQSPGRYKTAADAYLVAVKPFAPKEAAQGYASDNPEFKGLVVIMTAAKTEPAIGIERKVFVENLYYIQQGQIQRRNKKDDEINRSS